jgi:hypothetical protein
MIGRAIVVIVVAGLLGTQVVRNAAVAGLALRKRPSGDGNIDCDD